jgi:hypothetical protein
VEGKEGQVNSAPAEHARTHADFLKAELALGFTFITIASHRYETGYGESAGKSIVNAEKACATVSRFLTDPKHTTRLSETEIRDVAAELERLREELLKMERLKVQRKTKEN